MEGRALLLSSGMGLAFGRKHRIGPILFLDWIFRGLRRDCWRNFSAVPVCGSLLNSPDVSRCFQSQSEQESFAIGAQREAVRDTSRRLGSSRQTVEQDSGSRLKRPGELYPAALRIHDQGVRLFREQGGRR